MCPLPGMVVSPSEGAVPSKGQAMFKIHLNPDFVSKFETKVEVRYRQKGNIKLFSTPCWCSVCVHVSLSQIALRNMKSVELSVGGSVEPPNVEISVVSVLLALLKMLI